MESQSEQGAITAANVAEKLREAMPRLTDKDRAYLESLRAKYTSTKELANDQSDRRCGRTRHTLS